MSGEKKMRQFPTVEQFTNLHSYSSAYWLLVIKLTAGCHSNSSVYQLDLIHKFSAAVIAVVKSDDFYLILCSDSSGSQK